MGENVCLCGECVWEKSVFVRGSMCLGKKCVFMRGGERLFMHGKRLLYSIDLLGGGAGTWGKNAPTLSYPPSHIPKMKKLEL